MKKFLLFAVLVCSLSASAQARTPRSQVDVNQLAYDVCVSTTVAIDWTTAVNALTVAKTADTSVDITSSTVVEIYNPDDTNGLVYGFTSSVSTLTTSTGYGVEINSNTGKVLSVNLDKIGVFIKSLAASAKVTITACR